MCVSYQQHIACTTSFVKFEHSDRSRYVNSVRDELTKRVFKPSAVNWLPLRMPSSLRDDIFCTHEKGTQIMSMQCAYWHTSLQCQHL